MYNSQNLPLSPKKVIKKTITRYFRWFWFLLFLMLFLLPTFIRMQFLGGNLYTKLASWFFIFPFLLLLAIIIIIFAIPVLIYEYLYYKFYYYEFTDEKATIRKGVVSQATGLIRYERLQNIYVDQDFLDRIFGLYDVHYETAGETSGFYSHVDGLNKENADKLVAFLEEKTRQPMPAQGGKSEIPQVQTETKTGGEGGVSVREYPLSEAVIVTGTIIRIFFLSLLTFWIPLVLKSILLFLFGFSAILIISSVYSWVWYKNFYFNFSQDKGEIRTKVIGQSVSYLYYDRIQNINLSQSLFDRLLGIYTIGIETAGERAGLRLMIEGLPKESAEKIKDFLLAKAKDYKNRL